MNVVHSLLTRSDCDPTTFEEAIKESKWRKAMDEKIAAIERNNTWELTDLPKGHKTIGVKWVYKTKLKENGDADKNKALLVAKGYNNYARDQDDRKSTLGYVFMIGSRAVSWSLKKQPIVTLSTTKVEFVVVSSCACQAIWVRKILEELCFKQQGPTLIYCDKSSAIKFSKNPVLHGRSKHIDVKYHFLRNLSNDGIINLIFYRSEDQVVDIFTKPLKAPLFQKLQKLLVHGVQQGHQNRELHHRREWRMLSCWHRAKGWCAVVAVKPLQRVYVCNPSNREWVKLQWPWPVSHYDINIRGMALALAFDIDPSNDTFKLVRIKQVEEEEEELYLTFELYSSEEGLWRKSSETC
ncbi:Copia protein, partial [Mucuna pruriens]